MYLVDCYVLAVTEVAEVEILFFLLSVDFFWAENRCYNAAFRWKKTYEYLLYIVKLSLPLYFLLLRT